MNGLSEKLRNGLASETRIPDEPVADLLERARKYWRSAGRYEQAHWQASAKYLRRHHWLGGISVGLSAAAATSAFAALSETNITTLRVLTGALAVFTAVAASLLTFLGYDERAKQHRTAGARFAKLRRTIDLYVIELSGPRAPGRDQALASLRASLEELSSAVEASPSLSSREYMIGQRGFDDHYPIQANATA